MLYELPFVYTADVVLPKSRNVTKVAMLGRVPVNLSELDPDRAPVVASIMADTDRGTCRLDYRVDGEALFWPIAPWTSLQPVSLVSQLFPVAQAVDGSPDGLAVWTARFRESCRAGEKVTGFLPWTGGGWQTSAPVVHGADGESFAARSWVSDDRDICAAAAADAFISGCRLIDGLVWSRSAGPCWSLRWDERENAMTLSPVADFKAHALCRAQDDPYGFVFREPGWLGRRPSSDELLFRPGEEHLVAEAARNLVIRGCRDPSTIEVTGGIEILDRDLFQGFLDPGFDTISSCERLADQIEPFTLQLGEYFGEKCKLLRNASRSVYGMARMASMSIEIRRNWEGAYTDQPSPADRCLGGWPEAERLAARLLVSPGDHSNDGLRVRRA